MATLKETATPEINKFCDTATPWNNIYSNISDYTRVWIDNYIY
jgi:hypothetical protein